jgi:phage terminase Nu1 subunit (DNA packaging protein)
MITTSIEILTAKELRRLLDLDEGTISDLEENGMPFVQLPGQRKIYLAPSLRRYFHRIQERRRSEPSGNLPGGRKVNT